MLSKYCSNVTFKQLLVINNCVSNSVQINFQVLEEIEKHEIKIYPLPDCDSDEDEDYKDQVFLYSAMYHKS